MTDVISGWLALLVYFNICLDIKDKQSRKQISNPAQLTAYGGAYLPQLFLYAQTLSYGIPSLCHTNHWKVHVAKLCYKLFEYH